MILAIFAGIALLGSVLIVVSVCAKVRFLARAGRWLIEVCLGLVLCALVVTGALYVFGTSYLYSETTKTVNIIPAGDLYITRDGETYCFSGTEDGGPVSDYVLSFGAVTIRYSDDASVPSVVCASKCRSFDPHCLLIKWAALVLWPSDAERLCEKTWSVGEQYTVFLPPGAVIPERSND